MSPGPDDLAGLVSLVPVNRAFIGIPLPSAGEHRLIVTYDPPFIRPALWLGALGVLLAASIGWRLGRTRLPAAG